MFEYNGIVHRVIDGDTFIIDVDLGFESFRRVTFRILDLDTYETRMIKDTTEEQKARGIKIKNFAKELLEGKKVKIKTYMKKGFYKRYLCDVLFSIDEKKGFMNYADIPKVLGYDKNSVLNESYKYLDSKILEIIERHKMV